MKWTGLIFFVWLSVTSFNLRFDFSQKERPGVNIQVDCRYYTSVDALKKRIVAYMLYMGYERLLDDDFEVLTFEKMKNVTLHGKKKKGTLEGMYHERKVIHSITFNLKKNENQAWYLNLEMFRDLKSKKVVPVNHLVKGQTFNWQLLDEHLRSNFKNDCGD